MASPTINYLARDFQTLKQDLINFVKTRHSDKLSYFNENVPDIVLLELMAYVGDILSFYTDKTFNENFLSTAQARESLIRIANNLGFFETGPTPSSTQVTFSSTVPFKIDNTGNTVPDSDYLIGMKPGIKLSSDSGIFFEVLEEINFADPQNRTVVPNLDGNNQVIDFTIKKTAVAKAGTTKIQRFFVSDTLAKPFLEVTLDDKDITEIIGVVSVPGAIFTAPADEEFIDPTKTYFEVKFLTQDKKFVEVNPDTQPNSQSTSLIESVIKQGELIDIPKRFIVRRDVNDLVTLIFGSSSTSFGAFNSLIQTSIDPNTVSFNQILNNTALGEIPPANSTLFIKYRAGAGESTNSVTNQINGIISKAFFTAPITADITVLQQVRDSLTVTNELPALGGRGLPTDEELRQSIGKIFFTQDRAVTYEDVKNIINEMPARFGRPFRISYEEIKPRVANFTQIENGLNVFLNQILQETTQVGRQQKIQEIQQFLSDIQNGIAVVDPTNPTQPSATLATLSADLLSNSPTLWLGEKARIHVLGIDEGGQVSTVFKDSNNIWISPNELLKNNIKEFLKEKRIIGDWVDIVDGRVVNIQIEFTLMVDKKNKQQVLTDALNKMKDFFNIKNWQINQPIFVSNVQTALQEINGVLNVVDLKIYNIFGTDPITGKTYAPPETGRYRNNVLPAVNLTNNKFVMGTKNNVILGYSDTLFEVRFPDSDIIARAI